MGFSKVLASLLFLLVPLASAQMLYPNEPVGMSVIGVNDGSVKEFGGSAFGIGDFGSWDTNNIVVISDPTNPSGSGSSLLFTYGIDGHAGRAAADSFTNGSYDELYIMMWIYFEPGFYDDGVGGKIFYVGAQQGERNNVGSPTQFYSANTGGRFRFIQQNGGGPESELVDSFENPPKGANVEPLVIDSWNLVEHHLVASSAPGVSDGEVYLYVNGDLVGYRTGVDWATSSFDGLQWYAHVSSSLNNPRSYRLGELYISGKKNSSSFVDPPVSNISGPGDVDNSGIVDLNDLIFLTTRLGSSDPAADINNDGRVNIFDLVVVARNYGNDYNTPSCECSDNLCQVGNTGLVCDGCDYVMAPAEVCGGGDEDCDGQIDEGCSGVQPFFEDDFEGYSTTLSGWVDESFFWGQNRRTRLTDDREDYFARSGQHAMRFRFRSATDPNNGDAPVAFAEQRFDLGGNYPEAWIEYYMYFPDGTENLTIPSTGESWPYFEQVPQPGTTANHNKWIFVWGEDYYQNGTMGLEGNGVNGDPEASNPIVIGAISGSYPGIRPNPRPIILRPEDRGKWLRFRWHFKFESVDGAEDAAWEFWVDDRLVMSEISMQFYVPGFNHFTAGYLMGWAASGFEKETIILLDDFKIWDQDPGW